MNEVFIADLFHFLFHFFGIELGYYVVELLQVVYPVTRESRPRPFFLVEELLEYLDGIFSHLLTALQLR